MVGVRVNGKFQGHLPAFFPPFLLSEQRKHGHRLHAPVKGTSDAEWDQNGTEQIFSLGVMQSTSDPDSTNLIGEFITERSHVAYKKEKKPEMMTIS